MKLGKFSEYTYINGRVWGVTGGMHVKPLFLLTLQQDCWCRCTVSLSWAQGIWCIVLHHFISGQSSGLFPVSDAYSELLLFCASVQPWNAEAQGYRAAYESACFARQAGLVLMYLLCFYIMFYSVPHMVYAIFILVAWSVWLSGKLYWVLYKESYCSHLVKEETAVRKHAWFSDFWTKEFKGTCVRVLILNLPFRK